MRIQKILKNLKFLTNQCAVDAWPKELKIEWTASTKENMTQKLHTKSPKEKSITESLLLIKYKKDSVRC